MNFLLRQFSPARLLGLGLGITFLYVGVCSFADPTPWLGYIPGWLSAMVPAEPFAVAHGVFQVLLGAALLVGVLPRFASAVATLDLAAILVFYGIDLVTFRDIGLLFAALALFALSLELKNSLGEKMPNSLSNLPPKQIV